MNKPLLFALFFAVVWSSGAHSSAKTKAVTGTYVIAGKSILDPPESEPQDTHMKFYLTGRSARDLYKALPVRPRRDICLDDGSVTKSVGGTVCTRHVGGKEYRCSFAINLKTQRTENAIVC